MSNFPNPILGAANHRYEWLPHWCTLPQGVRYGYTHGLAVDSQGRIFVHNQSEHAMMIFDPEGTFIKSWGKEFAKGAHGLQLCKEANAEFLYLADTDRKIVVKTTLDGEVIWTLGYPQEAGVYPEGKGYTPTNVAFAPNGDFYVADGYGSSYIHQYDINARYIRSFGGKGSEAGQLNCPHGLWCDTRRAQPVLVVADRANQRLQNFTLDGKHLGFVTDELRHPCHFDQRGGDLLIPDLWGRVTIFDKNNKLITHLGDNPDVWKTKGWPNLPPEAMKPGKFNSPHSAIWDSQGNIYVAEWVAVGRVTKLRRLT